jgi:hypothetical protein
MNYAVVFERKLGKKQKLCILFCYLIVATYLILFICLFVCLFVWFFYILFNNILFFFI